MILFRVLSIRNINSIPLFNAIIFHSMLSHFHQVQLYVLQVEATDKDISNPLKSNVTLYINVLDENDNEPVFSPASYSPSISEGVGTGSPVVTVSAFDDDAGRFISVCVEGFSYLKRAFAYCAGQLIVEIDVCFVQ